MPHSALRQLLVQRSLRTGQRITLSTGRQSSFYFNCKPVTLSSEGAPLVAEAFLEKLALMPLPINAVGGRTMGADPIVMGMLMQGPQHGFCLEAFLVRENKKSHGTKELIANAPEPGTRVVIVDDVVTTGKSVLEAVDAARDAECVVVGVITLVDRLEERGAESIRSKVPLYYPIFTRDDFPEIGEAEACPTATSEQPSAQTGSTYTTSGI